MSLQHSTGVRRRALPLSQNGILLAFAATLFLSALLMFGVQPLFAKFVLPKLGGSSAVWSIALVFFQGVLLLGYAYAHLLTRFASSRASIFIHGTVMLAGLLLLPIGYPAGWEEVPSSGLPLWVLSLFAVGVGFPAFAISANAPLLQSWFSRTGHAHSNDPYFLYGASNVGSFAALLCYPFVMEPLLELGTQSWLWSAGYALLAAMILFCGFIMAQLALSSGSASLAGTAASGTDAPAQGAREATGTPTWTDRLSWIGLSMVPSGLLVGVTAFITTDLASAPFLWIVPLALFLATFVITFQRNPVIPHDTVRKLHAWIVAPLVIILLSHVLRGLYVSVIHLAVFFVCAMLCHGELVRRRPATSHLTEFYMLMSVGGVLGGLFTSLLAPQIFSNIFEYPILLGASFLCNPGVWQALRGKPDIKALWPVGVIAVLALAMVVEPLSELAFKLFFSAGVLLVVATVITRSQPLTQALLVAAGLMLVTSFGSDRNTIAQVRSFFGVNAVVAADNGRYHILKHGTTNHGMDERLDELGNPVTSRPNPISYYYAGGPIITVIRAVREHAGSLGDVMVMGLGAGAVACERGETERWRYIEIDPEVIKLARKKEYFRFLDACGESEGIVLADGRIALSHEPDGKFDLIFMDAFSSDSVPAHLLTAEAMELYFSKLKPNGVVLVHVSNRHMELASVVAAVARKTGGVAYTNTNTDPHWGHDPAHFRYAAKVVVVARSAEDIGSLAHDPYWRSMEQDTVPAVWTDSYSNVLSAIWRKKFGE